MRKIKILIPTVCFFLKNRILCSVQVALFDGWRCISLMGENDGLRFVDTDVDLVQYAEPTVEK